MGTMEKSRKDADLSKRTFPDREMDPESEDFPFSSFFPRFNSDAGGFKRRMCVVKLDGCRFTIGKGSTINHLWGRCKSKKNLFRETLKKY